MNATLVRRVERLEKQYDGDRGGPREVWVRYLDDWRDPTERDSDLLVELMTCRAYQNGIEISMPAWLLPPLSADRLGGEA